MISTLEVAASMRKHDRRHGVRLPKVGKRDIATLKLCIASAWLFGAISRGRAIEVAAAIGCSAEEIENLKYLEECKAEAEAPTAAAREAGADAGR